MSYTFTFDASACSGCKACQEACKDKNNLPVGLLWRRVIEVTGGEWRSVGNAWENNVFAYHVTLACNHCAHPKCAGVCPTDAYIVRPDGIVRIDSSRCMGCGYCAWACPYGAPQYDSQQGIMTKCNLCYDRLDAGLPPSCVAACPLRVLNVETLEEGRTSDHRLNLWQLPASEHPFPLPNYARTEPHLAIKPHAGMNSPLAKAVSNLEEVQPAEFSAGTPRAAGRGELPLVGFTLLTQMAAGMAVFSLRLSPLPTPVLLSIGILLALGGLIAFLHLGRKHNAWRAVLHLKKSWLSREVLLAGLFGAAWMITYGLHWLRKASPKPWPMALLALGLIYCMARVYYLRTVAAWNSWRTLLSFTLSAVVLGALGVNLFAPQPVWSIIAGIGILAEIGLVFSTRRACQGSGQALSITPPPKTRFWWRWEGAASRLHIALLGLGAIGVLLLALLAQTYPTWLAILVFIIALVAEVIGRWQFYVARVPFLMHVNHS